MTLATFANVTLTETAIRPIDTVGGVLLGTDIASGNEIHESSDDGASWALTNDMGTGSSINAIRALADGEVIVSRRAQGLWKSDGWVTNRTTATWSQVLSPTEGAWILPWGVDVSGSVVLATEYANAPRDASRKVWVSANNGDTFTDVLDLDVMYPGQESAVHWHAVCIDPYADNRLWAIHGDGIAGMYYSDDLGDNWTLLSDERQVTAMAAGRLGIVCGSDELNAGLFRILRTDNPDDMKVEGIPNAGIPAAGWYGFATKAWRDLDSELVYMAFQVDTEGLPAHIMVSDGRDGHSIWSGGESDTPKINNLTTNDGVLIADLNDGGTRLLLRGELSQ